MLRWFPIIVCASLLRTIFASLERAHESVLVQNVKRPSHGKFKLANSWRQIKLVSVWTAQKQLANTLANCWQQIELFSPTFLTNFFTNFFVLANSYLTRERFANVCWWLSPNQNTRYVHVICVTLHKMADGREDERATFQFIYEVQNCPDLWDVSSAEYKNTKKADGALRRACCTLHGSDLYWYTVSFKP